QALPVRAMSGLIAALHALGGDMAVVAVLAALLASAAIAAYGALAPLPPLKTRLHAVAARARGEAAPDSERRRAMRSLSSVRRLVERLKLTSGEEAKRNASLLLQAGWRSPEALVIYSGLRLALPIGLGVLGVVIGVVFKLDALPRLTAGCFGAVAGLYLPVAVVRSFVSARHRALNNALPDALDLLVICAESGLGVDGALSRVARELARFQPLLAEELHVTGLELGFLPNRRDALNNLAQRIDIPPMRTFVNTLIQTERYGTPLAQALKLLSGEMREERMLKAEEKAAKLPALMTVPMIVFILPAMFMLLIGPALMDIMAALK
ncbi:MAG TPA: type II secretion system F family protein, partial [Stellaceae bacterium]|nr:type II secretion system F family protein [Stellaceae bacterium]